MKLSEFPLMVGYDGDSSCPPGIYIVKEGTDRTPDTNTGPIGRVYAWAHMMRRYGAEMYGDWNIRETCVSAACRGTVVATLKGPRGTVEAWNGHDVYFIPKGVKMSKEPYPYCKEIDANNGVQWQFDSHDMRGDIAWACNLAGIPIQERMAI